MVYNVPALTISFLKDNGWEVYEGELNQHIILQRFFDISNLCDIFSKRMGYLALLANISTLVGLLGTIYGLIQSFGAVASADPASKAKLLALGISKAMNTTA